MMGPKYDWYPYLDSDMQERRSCEDGGRNWSDTSIGQGTPRIASEYQKLEENPSLELEPCSSLTP